MQCNASKKNSYPGVRAHLLKLPVVGLELVQNLLLKILRLKKMEDEAKENKVKNPPKKVPLTPSSPSVLSFILKGYESEKRKTSANGSISTVEKAFDKQKCDQLHTEIARMF